MCKHAIGLFSVIFVYLSVGCCWLFLLLFVIFIFCWFPKQLVDALVNNQPWSCECMRQNKPGISLMDLAKESMLLLLLSLLSLLLSLLSLLLSLLSSLLSLLLSLLLSTTIDT